MVTINEWHKQELEIDYQLGPVRMVTGCPLYGEPYVTDFLAYCLPTLLAPQNWTALAAHGWEYILFVDGPAEERLRAAGLPKQFRLRRLPDDIVATLYASPGLKYPLLAAVHNLLIHKARDIGAGFHMTVADTVYCEGYFARLLELAEEHEAIAQTGFAIVSGTGLPALAAYRKGALVIPPGELGRIGWEHLNPQWASWTMDGITDFEEMPNSHYIHWRGRDSVRIHCAHQTATWIGPERCRQVEPGLGGTVDSELPRYIAGDFYAPRLSDEMVYVVIAGASAPTPRISFADYKAEFWRFLGADRPELDNRFVPYFSRPCPLPVPYDGNCPDDPELDARLGRLMEKLHGA